MRLCLASNLYPPDVIGGAETMVAHLAHGLRSAGCELTVLTTAPRARAGTQLADDVTVHRIPTGNLYWTGDAARQRRAAKALWHTVDLWNPSVYRRVCRILAGGKFDLVHTHNLGGLSPSVWSAASRTGTPIVHTPHDYSLTCVRSTRMTPAGQTCWTPCRPCGVRGMWLRRLSLLVDAVVAPSRFVLDRHVDLGFFRHAKCSIVPWGLPDAGLTPEPAPRDRHVTFLYLGHLAAHKGVRVLLEAWGHVHHAGARLDIAGSGPLEGECTRAAAADPRIHFHGFVRGDDKARLFAAADVLLFPSVCWEVAGLVALEAFAYGTPVVASRTGGIPEFVENGVTGFLLEPGDSGALAARIEELAREPDRIRRFAPACRAAATWFTIDRTIAGLLAVYRETMGG